MKTSWTPSTASSAFSSGCSGGRLLCAATFTARSSHRFQVRLVFRDQAQQIRGTHEKIHRLPLEGDHVGSATVGDNKSVTKGRGILRRCVERSGQGVAVAGPRASASQPHQAFPRCSIQNEVNSPKKPRRFLQRVPLKTHIASSRFGSGSELPPSHTPVATPGSAPVPTKGPVPRK